jgi:hypothetical protein
MTEIDVVSEHPNLNEGCETTQGGTPHTLPARVTAVAESKTKLKLICNDSG